MKWRCPDAEIIGTGNINGYQLEFNRHLTITKKKDSIVPVAIYKINATDENSLDRYEGYPIYYRKQNIKVETKDGNINAMVYIMNREGAFPPTREYYNTCLEGYEDFGFNPQTLQKALEETIEKYEREN